MIVEARDEYKKSGADSISYYMQRDKEKIFLRSVIIHLIFMEVTIYI